MLIGEEMQFRKFLSFVKNDLNLSRLSTVVNCDEILVLDEGTVSERGTHQDLLSRPNSLYKQLWDSQHKAALAEKIMLDHGVSLDEVTEELVKKEERKKEELRKEEDQQDRRSKKTKK